MALSNDDFRKIMMTPRPASGAASATFATPMRGELPEKKKKEWKKPRPPKEPKEEPWSHYRDRAAERRTGEDVDIAESTAEVLASRTDDPEKAKADLELEREIAKKTDLGVLAEAEPKKKTGLDFKVLAQIRSEIERERAQKQKEEEAARPEQERKQEEERQHASRGPQSELAKAIARTLFDRKARKAEQILPRRKLLRYNVAGDAPSDQPLVVILNKEDVVEENSCVARLDPKASANVSKIMAYLTDRRKDHHPKKKEKEKAPDKLRNLLEPALRMVPLVLPSRAQPPAENGVQKEGENGHAEDKAMEEAEASKPAVAAAAPAPAPPTPMEEDDIFPSAGDYVPTLKKKEAETVPALPKAGASYFGSAEKITGLEDLKLQGPQIKLKAGVQKEQDEEERGEADMEMDEGEAKQPALGPAAGPARPPSVESYGAYPEVEEYPNTDAQFGAPAPVRQTALDLAAAGAAVVEEKPMTEQEAAAKGFKTVFRRDDDRLRQVKEKDKREKDPTFVSDSYTECYPGAYETTFEVYDASDDDDDPTKMDQGSGKEAKKQRLKRWDFNTEEEWSAYNASKEANPKAAYQFGVKTSDGRKTRKDSDKDGPKKKKKDGNAKLNSELQRIEAHMKKRQTEGAYDTAKRPKTGGEDG